MEVGGQLHAPAALASGKNPATYWVRPRPGLDSSVGVATRYGIDCRGIEPRWGRNFPQPYRPALGPTQTPVQWVPGLFQGIKRPGRGVDHPLSGVEVKERVEL
jgi:hypothetical protein